MEQRKVHAQMTTNCAKMMERAQVHNIIRKVNTVAIIISIAANSPQRVLSYTFYYRTYLEYTWVESSYCPRFYTIQEYNKLSQAREACSSDLSCISVVDYYCGNQSFWTCSVNILPSAVGSCTWTVKKKEINGNILSIQYN